LEFAYKVRDRSGKILKGQLEAEDKNIVISSLINQNYYILSLEQVQKSSKEVELSLGRVKTRDLIVMTRQLATMMAAGLPILKCFVILGEQVNNKKLKKTIFTIHDDIEEGIPLWQAVARHPDVFSPVYISMVRAGELGGILDTILDRLSIHLEREQEINSKIKSASIYPAIISIVAIIMVFCIITFIMPTFTGMFQASGATLPAPTRILLGLSDFFRHYLLHLSIAIVVVIFLLKRWGRTNSGRFFFDNLYLHLPIIGKTLSRITVARFARTMGTLLRSGIPVLAALEVVEEVVGNAVISRAIRSARESISEGDSITVPLAATGVFEPMVTQMIAVGEETGSLDEMLIRMSDYFEKELGYMIDSLMAVIEPVLILFVALLVGGIVIATLLPMFEIVNTVG
jgi:type IV pilus assembly protein PilC